MDAKSCAAWAVTIALGIACHQAVSIAAGGLDVNVDLTGGEVQAVLAVRPACGKVEGDRRDVIVLYAASDLMNLAGREVRLLLTAKNARIFSYWRAPAKR